MFIRDAAIGQYLPDVQQLSGYFSYRGGQAVFYYIAKKYGKEKIGEVINALRSVGSVDAAFKQTIGLNFKEFNKFLQKHGDNYLIMDLLPKLLKIVKRG